MKNRPPDLLLAREFTDSTVASYFSDPFESHLFEKNCGKLIIESPLPVEFDNNFIKIIVSDFNKLNLDYVTCRLPSALHKKSDSFLQKFILVDSITEFSKSKLQVNGARGSICSLQKKNILLEELRQLTREAFQISRYHNDPMIGKILADQVYNRWAENIYNEIVADHVFYGSVDNASLSGFCSIQKKDGGTYSEIGLIAVSSEYQGCGLGKYLVQLAENWSIENKISELRVKTQSNNSPAVKLYQSCGMSIFETYKTFRWAKSE